MPKVSIILPSFNSSSYIYESIKSILNQSFKNFELIVIDDKSADQSIKIIKSFRDKRIKLIITKKRLGLAASLNLGIKSSTSKYIARMDSDDISEYNRVEEQVKFLEKNRHIDILGTAVKIIDEAGRIKKFLSYPKNHLEIKWAMCLGCPIAHPTVMIRKNIFKKFGMYDSKEKLEDYALWTKFLNRDVKFYNLDKYLLRLRKHEKNLSKNGLVKFKRHEINIIKKNINNIINFKITKEREVKSLEILSSNGKIKNRYTEEALKLLNLIFFKFREIYIEPKKKKYLKSIKKLFYEKIFMVRIRNLNDYKTFIAFSVSIILNFEFIIYLFFKVTNNYYKKLVNNLKFNLDSEFRF